MANPAGGFVQNMPHGKFETPFVGHSTHNSERFPVGIPISPFDILGNLAGRSTD
jgi:hypothetical protein